ncbi:hypothetical protein Agabi119p4_6390 [Agaricus bisporus var. burnettii]|uniref:Uncharacterized protein n=1 Tax=Agaricus bisporus var. burnettii TaxID=192524 RepID=A0A8H7C9T3_AGABI|nr:hypothetical protein Agabi119p4_6390 [Agaricus bisporus var. burnettii]
MSTHVLMLLCVLALLHAGYSAYEYLSRLKALGLPQEGLPKDIAIEVLVARCGNIKSTKWMLGSALPATHIAEEIYFRKPRKNECYQWCSAAKTLAFLFRRRWRPWVQGWIMKLTFNWNDS